MSKKVNTEGLDSAHIIEHTSARNRRLAANSAPVESEPETESNLEHTQAPAPIPATSDEQPKRKSSHQRNRHPDYQEIFVRRNELKTRQCVYINHQTHASITKLVRALVDGGNEITVGGYIDAVLNEHLQLYKEDINEIYRRERGDLL